MIIRTKDFQIPKKMEIETETLTGTYGKFFAEPFERGFGATIGNSLRRILLSSIAGAAVTSVKIEGVLHEFSTIPGVKEDVTDIILNVKNLRFKLHTDRSKTVRLKKKGPGEARAKDVIHDADVEILNPDLHIATLDKEANMDMEMVIRIGSGYVPADRNKEEGMPIGVIPVDSIFSPIKKVNFTVENARVGRITDYDKLIMEIWTDGGVKPDDALAYAAKILKDHMAIFINFDESIEPVHEPVDDKKTDFNKNLFRSVHELELSVRAANCLKNASIKTIGDLVQKTESEMLRTKNFGRKSLNEIKEILAGMGLSLGMKVDYQPTGEGSEKGG
ncbi:MAG TPA: DNA-directed RNA polymerase subunit alpha [Nitrospiria bacterium]|nr:DNA-directed RNA polymerase subunit alpha [Nitrospiria bacterium]HUK57532.1 DNA-directed RNA polymerase subunit alpha [Nitrospiria bacterium]